MVNTDRLYKQLKNGKQVQMFYKNANSISYTISLAFREGVFTLHSFHFAGNDVYQDSNYQDEHIENFDNFQTFCNRIVDKFPGIECA